MASERTFTLVSPHLTGEDIRQFQRDLSGRFKAWDINIRIADDGDYGSATRDAGQQVCKGLGILHEVAMNDGVTPALRIKIRHPDTRTPQEIARSDSPDAKDFRAKLRERFQHAPAEFDGVAVASWIVPSLQWAREHGWTGHVNSGFRSCEHQKVVAVNRMAGDERESQPPTVFVVGVVAASQACAKLHRWWLARAVQGNIVEQVELDGHRRQGAELRECGHCEQRLGQVRLDSGSAARPDAFNRSNRRGHSRRA